MLKKAHLLRWRPRPHAQRRETTPRVRPSGAASHLDLFEHPAALQQSPREVRHGLHRYERRSGVPGRGPRVPRGQCRAQERHVRDLAEPVRRRGPPARQGVPAQEGRGGIRRARLARGLGRPRAVADLPGDLRAGGDALPRAARLLRDRPRHVHADPVHLRHRGGQAPLRAAGPAGRRGVVSALLRARGRLGPGRAAHARGARRR